jgi:hypothetical protein
MDRATLRGGAYGDDSSICSMQYIVRADAGGTRGGNAGALERDGGSGRLRLVGTPPGGARAIVPDFRYAAYEP